MPTNESCKIVCSKYDNLIMFDALNQKKNIYHPKSKSLKGNFNLKPLATNGEVFFDGIKIFTFDELYDSLEANVTKLLIVLTEKERSLVLSWAVRCKITIIVLETSFPIFRNIKYSKDVNKSYDRLTKCLDYLKTLGITSKSLSSNFSRGLINSIKRKVRYKTNLDKYFHLAYLSPFQEVFKFSEERDDRCIIALDFNSMFSACLEGGFLEPKSVYFKGINGSVNKTV